MSPQNKKTFKIKKDSSLGIVLIMLAMTFVNLAPGFMQGTSSSADEQVTAQLTPSPPATRYIIVDEDGSTFDPMFTCVVHGISEAYPLSLPNNCNLGEAINTANGDVSILTADPITIIFAASLPQVTLESTELPAIQRITNPVIIDGCQSVDCSVKEIIKGNIDNEWAFKVNTEQDVVIRNMAFISLPDPESAAIRTAEKSPPWFLGNLLIENNYFGSTNGQNFVGGNEIMSGMYLVIDPTASNDISVTVRNNIFYGVQANPINISAKADGGPECNETDGAVSPANLRISNNKIGIKKDGSGGEGGYASGDEWGNSTNGGFAAAFICGVRAEIDSNVIGNSRFQPSGAAAILLIKVAANIHHNHIGVLESGVGNTNIFGTGILVGANYSTNNFANSTQIHDNIIGNIKRQDCSPTTYNLDPGRQACSGSAIRIFSTHTLTYNNQIGGKDTENDGYGVSIEGIITGSGSETPATAGSSFNKVFNNTISYNKADGIHVPAVLKVILPTPPTTDFGCTDSSSGSSFPPQSCFNTFSQNKIFRNGRYNEAVAPGFPSAPPFPAGGIGIDLKSGSGATDDNYLEQKEGTTASPDGTHNDSDININDFSDADKGSNDLINYPTINPATGSPTPNSSRELISGNLSTNAPGRYWVEVFRVRCNAENDDGNTNEIDSLTGQCDTDEKDPGFGPENKLVNGQGFEFLCGAYVTKSVSNAGEWDCKPSDFGNVFNGGLITSTVTEANNTDVGLSFGKNIVPAVPLKYSCELAQIVFGLAVGGGEQPCTGENLGTGDYTNLGGLEANLIQALGNTSEFSEDVFIPTPDLSINKKVRGCTGTTKETCVINSFQTETTTPNSTTVEYRVDTFNNGNSSLALSINDNQPSGVTFNQAQCEYFIVDTVTDARPGSGAQPCTFTSNNLTLPGGSGTISVPMKKHLVVYVLGTVNGSGTIANTGTVTETTLCPGGVGASCNSEARIIIQAPAGDVTLTKSVTPSTVNSGPSAQDVTYTVTLTKSNTTTISNATWSDNFPVTPVAMTYKDCSVSVTPASASAGITCPTLSPPNNNPGNLFAGNLATEITQIIFTYKGTVPANAVTSGTGVTVTNTTEFLGFNGTTNLNKQASANLTILPPGTTGTGAVVLKHVFDNPDTGAMVSTVTSSTAVIDKDYFIVVNFNNVPVSGITGFKLSNNFAVTAANLNSPMTYSDCQINYFGVTPGGAPVTCTIPTIGGNVEFYPTGLNVPQGLTKIIVKYKGHVPAGAVAAGSTAFVINRALVDAPGINDVVRATATASADTTLNINGPGLPPGSSSIEMTKTADNNVTGDDRTSERIYNPGETVNYSINILNNGTGIASGAVLRDSLHKNLTNLANDQLPVGSTGGFSENNLTVSSISVPTGSAGVNIKYRGTIKSNSQFSLSEFGLNSGADPKVDEDFYAQSTADIDENVDITNNKHQDENDALDIPDNKFVSLGDNGDITIDLGEKVIVDGSGDDFGILEIDNSADDNDQETEAYRVSVSQDGHRFEQISSGSENTEAFDLGRADMTWARFIKIEDKSLQTIADAPGADIDAICLFNIGVQLPNTASVQLNGQNLTDNELVTVDVTDVFDDQLKDEDCREPEAPAPVIVFPPGPPNIIVPPPEKLPVTGPVSTGLASILGAIAWIKRRRK